MKQIHPTWLAILLFVLPTAPHACAESPTATTPPAIQLTTRIYTHTLGMPRFPDFGFMLPPSEYHGRVFLLSQDFPWQRPMIGQGERQILAIDFKEDWYKYSMAVRAYVFEGNTGHGDYNDDFYLEDNKVRNWYHVPWQHWGPTGREGVHGLTQEGPIDAKMLAPTQTTGTSHAYAVGFYNSLGGYLIGQVWQNPDHPNLAALDNHGFPVGTVVAKLLFTTLDEKEVPYLQNPIEWQAYVYDSDMPGAAPPDKGKSHCHAQPPRSIQTVRLIQMDIMVRDNRAIDTGGWVFGTFMYNGALGNENRWENMVPVGLMWGNDPTVDINLSNPTPTETKTNPALKETAINTGDELPPTHLGWGYRLNGPVDNPQSSCMSCHSTAQYPAVSAIMPFLSKPPINPPKEQGQPASPEWMRWFRNVPCATAFDPGQATSTDYSLQLSKSIANFIEYKSKDVRGLFGVEYWQKGHQIHRNVIMPAE